MESIRIDWKNSIVVGSVIENTKTDGSRLVLVPCMRVLTVRIRVMSSQVRVHHCSQVQVLKMYTRALLEYKYKFQVLQLWKSDCSGATLSSVPDTVEHKTLLHHLEKSYDPCRLPCARLVPVINYLSSQLQSVRCRRSSSTMTKLVCGVPMGSNLGKFCFLRFVNAASTPISKMTTHGFCRLVD